MKVRIVLRVECDDPVWLLRDEDIVEVDRLPTVGDWTRLKKELVKQGVEIGNQAGD